MAFHFTTANRIFMDIPGGWQFNGPRLTVSVWIYRTSTTTWPLANIVCKYPGQGFQRLRIQVETSTNKLRFGANWNVQYSTWISAGTGLGTDAWHHIVCTGDGSNAKLAIDGSIETKSGANGGINDFTGVSAGVGGSDDNSEYWTGWLAELAMWDFGMFPDAHITALARGANPLKIMSAQLVGYWPMRGTTIPIADLSGNGRHLTEHFFNPDQYTDPTVHPPVQLAMV